MAYECRRIVTGHTPEGKPTVLYDSSMLLLEADRAAGTRQEDRAGAASTVIWTTQGPVTNDDPSDTALRKVGTAESDGTVFRIVRYAPGVAPRHHRTNWNAGRRPTERKGHAIWVNTGALPEVSPEYRNGERTMPYGHAERNLALVRQLEAQTRQLLESLDRLDPEQSAWLQEVTRPHRPDVRNPGTITPRPTGRNPE
jgi:hypothetical protein